MQPRTLRLVVLLGLLLLLPRAAAAQATDSYGLWISNGGPPVLTVLSATSFVCNQAVVAGGTVNPDKVKFTDPDPTHAGKDCVYQDPGTGPLLVLPLGPANYTAQLDARAGTLASGLSTPPAPFTKPGVAPPVPTGVRILK